MKQIRLGLYAVFFTLMAGAAVFAQQRATPANQQQEAIPDPGFVIRTETQLVLVPFHVVRKGQYVEDLQKEDVRILEDGKPQSIAIFEGPPGAEGKRRTVPVEVILLLDVSLSVMNKDLLDPVAVKETFFDELGEDVTVAVYGFAQNTKRFCRPTRDSVKLEKALMDVYGFQALGTRLYESIIYTCRDAASRGGTVTRLMVVLSDGFSTTKALPRKAIEAARRYGITLYPVILGHDRLSRRASGAGGGKAANPKTRNVWGGQRLPGIGDPGRGGSVQQRQAQTHYQENQMADFAEIGEQTGGRSFDPQTVNSLIIRAILGAVVAQVETEYVAGYYPSGEGNKNKKPSKVEVKFAKNAKVKGKIHGGRRLVAR